jgi:Tfp pilus assembly protein PilF
MLVDMVANQGELAIESAKKAIALAPDDSYTHYALACAYKYHGLITRSERAAFYWRKPPESVLALSSSDVYKNTKIGL